MVLDWDWQSHDYVWARYFDRGNHERPFIICRARQMLVSPLDFSPIVHLNDRLAFYRSKVWGRSSKQDRLTMIDILYSTTDKRKGKCEFAEDWSWRWPLRHCSEDYPPTRPTWH